MSKEAQKKYRLAHPEAYKESLRKWREKNPNKSKLYRKTFKGYFCEVYARIKKRCSGGDQRYKDMAYMKPYEWKFFLEETTSPRRVLYDAWVNSGYQLRMSPSIDRIKSDMGYIFDNCRWLPQWENSSNGGKIGGHCKNRYPAAGE